jgi:hypothetical protein
MNSDWSDYRHDITTQTCIYILNTTTTICGENCGSLWVQHHSCRKMHWLTLWSRVLPIAYQLFLSKARSIQPIPSQPIYWRSILILSSHLCLGHTSVLFQVSHQNPVGASPFPHICHTNLTISSLLIWSLNATLVRSTVVSRARWKWQGTPVLTERLVPEGWWFRLVLDT